MGHLWSSVPSATAKPYWPTTFAVCGEIRDLYNSLGGPLRLVVVPRVRRADEPRRSVIGVAGATWGYLRHRVCDASGYSRPVVDDNAEIAFSWSRIAEVLERNGVDIDPIDADPRQPPLLEIRYRLGTLRMRSDAIRADVRYGECRSSAMGAR